MKLVYLANVDLAGDNGPGVNEREFTAVMQAESDRRGDECHFITPPPSKPLDFELKSHYVFDSGEGQRALSRFGRMWLRKRQLKEALAHHPSWDLADLFVIRPHVDLLWAAQWLLDQNRPVAFKTLEDICNFFSKKVKLRKTLVYAPLARYLLRRILPRAVAVDCCTPQLCQIYKERLGAGNLSLVDNAVNTDRFSPRDRGASRREMGLPFDQVVGYAGGEPSNRGVRQIVEAAPILLNSFPNCGFIVMGDDSGLERLKARVREGGLENRFVFYGKIPYEELVRYINCLDVGIALDRSARLESSGNSSQKIRQYIACGVPFVGARNTNDALLKEGFGVSVDPDALEEFVDSVAKWLREPDDLAQRHRRYAYAKNNLSMVQAYEKRYRLWTRKE